MHQPLDALMYSLIIPVYRNEANLPHLLQALCDMHAQTDQPLEVVLVEKKN